MPQSFLELSSSSNLSYAVHTPETQGMILGFKNGSIYEYAGVTTELYGRFGKSNAEEPHKSFGKFFHAEIRGKFQEKKIRDADPKPTKEIPNAEGQKEVQAGTPHAS